MTREVIAARSVGEAICIAGALVGDIVSRGSAKFGGSNEMGVLFV